MVLAQSRLLRVPLPLILISKIHSFLVHKNGLIIHPGIQVLYHYRTINNLIFFSRYDNQNQVSKNAIHCRLLLKNDLPLRPNLSKYPFPKIKHVSGLSHQSLTKLLLTTF